MKYLLLLALLLPLAAHADHRPHTRRWHARHLAKIQAARVRTHAHFTAPTR